MTSAADQRCRDPRPSRMDVVRALLSHPELPLTSAAGALAACVGTAAAWVVVYAVLGSHAHPTSILLVGPPIVVAVTVGICSLRMAWEDAREIAAKGVE